jgi:hypothetical protein
MTKAMSAEERAVVAEHVPIPVALNPAPPPVRRDETRATPDRERRLYDLLDLCRSYGMTDQELADSYIIGDCSAQVGLRIVGAEDWLIAHRIPIPA